MLVSAVIRQYFSLANSFAVLGLKSNAKLEEVKKKYYQLAKLHHPDLNTHDSNANKKFMEITNAYRFVVQNYDKNQGFFTAKPKQQTTTKDSYPKDSTLRNDKRQKTKMQQGDFQDFHDYDLFFKQNKKFRKPRAGDDIYINLTVTLQQSILGAHRQVAFTKYEPCLDCANKPFSACFSCGGKGQIYDRVNREKVRCEYCSGKGHKNQCTSCMGASYVLKQAKETIYIQKGTQDKSILKVERKGHSGYKADNGDLFITVMVEENKKFRIDGNNVHMDYELDFVTAACGGIAYIETVHGVKEVKIEAGTQSGAEVRIFNAGLKSPYSKRMGDQVIKIKIKIPESLSSKQKLLLQKLCELEC